MIDFHSHILPAIDDGSSSVAESLDMLKIAYQQGVRLMVATPHFYAEKESPEHFLERREAAWKRLAPRVGEGMPEVRLGAEIYYFNGISQMENIEQLTIEDSDVLLLEMPFRRWTDQMIDEIVSLAQTPGLTVMLAHIDRYFSWQSKDTWAYLEDCGVRFQLNGSVFLGKWRPRHKALKMIKDRRISALGSDCHNLSSRKPNLEEAAEVICKKIGRFGVTRVMRKSEKLLAGEELFS